MPYKTQRDSDRIAGRRKREPEGSPLQGNGSMREHETNFLRHLLLACGTTESRKLDDILCQAQINERCVRRTIWWTLQLILLALAGLGYTTVLP